MENAERLTGGNASGEVLRIGSTVRKLWSVSTPSVHDFMSTVRSAGVSVPEVYGRDELGRQMIEFVPGRFALDSGPLTDKELEAAGGTVRAIHDASAGYTPSQKAVWDIAIPAPAEELVCHNDLAPWNLIIGEKYTFIDWDGAGPSTRLWDLAYAAQAFTLNDPEQAPHQAAKHLAVFVSGYGAGSDMRQQLPLTMWQRSASMYDLLKSSHESGREPWASMFAHGHGAHWQSVTQYLDQHQELWHQALRQHP